MSVRIYTPLLLQPASSITLDPAASHHLAHVLRKKAGFCFNLFNGDGHEFSATIHNIHKRIVEVEVAELVHTEAEAILQLNLLMAISKGDRMEIALQKAVELGIHSITPIISERTVVRLSNERLSKKMDHWWKIIVSACEQSGRCRLPKLFPVQPIDQIVSNVPAGMSLILDHRGEQSLDQLTAPLSGSVNLTVGPEGGFSESERGGLVNAGFKMVPLGPRVLRTETAPLAALAAIQMLWGDFRCGQT